MYQYNLGGFFYILDSYVGKLRHITSQLRIQKLSGSCGHIRRCTETFIRPEGSSRKCKIPCIICPSSHRKVDE